MTMPTRGKSDVDSALLISAQRVCAIACRRLRDHCGPNDESATDNARPDESFGFNTNFNSHDSSASKVASRRKCSAPIQHDAGAIVRYAAADQPGDGTAI